MRKLDIERNKGKVYCTIRQVCEGECATQNFRRNGRICGEAFYKTPDGEAAVKN